MPTEKAAFSLPSHRIAQVALGAMAVLLASECVAHGIADQDTKFLLLNKGPAVLEYMYLGAKHMVTGVDHLLFLAGVIFFLYRLKGRHYLCHLVCPGPQPDPAHRRFGWCACKPIPGGCHYWFVCGLQGF